MVWALLPLKDFVDAKQRLSGVLAPHERRRLFQAMVEDVLTVLSQHHAIDQTLIISDDPSASLLADRYNVEHLEESTLQARGLNGVIEAGAAYLAGRGIDSVMTVHGDLPLISTEELQQLIDSHMRLLDGEECAVTIAPDNHGTGSNVLLCTPPQVISFHYGENSFQKHGAEAARRGVTLNVETLPGLACDIDNPADLNELLETHQTLKHSFRYLQDSGIAERLSAMAIGGQTIADAIGEAER
jgi:2-phospho-L-lactate guanylyltransferase